MTDNEKLTLIEEIVNEYINGDRESDYYMEQVCDVMSGNYKYSNYKHLKEKIEVYPNKS